MLGILTVAGCSTGPDALSQTGNDSGYVATRVGQVIAAADRKAALLLSGKTFGGKNFDLSTDRGKVIVLNFWASWCPPCRVEAPDLESVYKAEAARGLRMVGVDVKDTRSWAESFIKDKALSYPMLWDPESRIALAIRNFPVGTIPATLVIDRRGRVAALYARPILRSDLLSAIKPLLAE
jgi:thiol-disulfide isomerase/thioredoxin